MCELLGLSFNLPVVANISFKGLQAGAETHKDGWGFAAIEHGSVKDLRRDPCSMLKTDLSEFQNVRATTFISHIRNASRGRIAEENCHPFRKDFRGGDLVFAHNGTIQTFPGDTGKVIDIDRYPSEGETDSEKGMRTLMAIAEERGVSMGDFDAIHEIFVELNELCTPRKNENKFNILMAHGDLLYCYADIFGNGGLWKAHRKPPFDTIRLRDDDLQIELAAEKPAAETGFVIATARITRGDSWEKLTNGELIVFENGTERYRKS